MRKIRKELRAIKAKYHNKPRKVKEEAHDWFMSQAKWHQRRATWLFGHVAQHWHEEQAIFYRRAAWEVFSFPEMVQRVMEKHTVAIVANAQQNNALFRLLKETRSNDNTARP